jgi:hypothetical protein
MKRYRVVSATSEKSPVVRLQFEDGLTGDVDLTPYLEKGGYYDLLRDPSAFSQVAIGMNGRCFGWRLDDVGNEIDFSADGARADIETALVEKRAERYRKTMRQAAE